MTKNLLIIILLFLFTGCSTLTTNYQSDTTVVVQVESDNYEIVGDIEGEATSHLIIPLYPFLYYYQLLLTIFRLSIEIFSLKII